MLRVDEAGILDTGMQPELAGPADAVGDAWRRPRIYRAVRDVG